MLVVQCLQNIQVQKQPEPVDSNQINSNVEDTQKQSDTRRPLTFCFEFEHMQVGEISEINEFLQEINQMFAKNGQILQLKFKGNINFSDDGYPTADELGDSNQIVSEIEPDLENQGIDDLLRNLG